MAWCISPLFWLMGKPCLMLRIKLTKIDVAPGTYTVTCITDTWIMVSRWRHQMEIFSVLLALCAGNSPVTGEFHPQRPVTRRFDVFCDLRQSKRLSKQSWGWWFQTPSHPSWRRRCTELILRVPDKMAGSLQTFSNAISAHTIGLDIGWICAQSTSH